MRRFKLRGVCGALVLAQALIATHAAQARDVAAYWDGQTLYDNCTGGDVPVCVGYLMAILDASNRKEFGPLSLQDFTPSFPHYCFPDGEDVGTALDAVVAYLRAHPEKLHQNAATLTILALSRAFPCGYPLGRRPGAAARPPPN